MYECIYIHIHTHTQTHTHVCICMYECVWIYIYQKKEKKGKEPGGRRACGCEPGRCFQAALWTLKCTPETLAPTPWPAKTKIIK